MGTDGTPEPADSSREELRRAHFVVFSTRESIAVNAVSILALAETIAAIFLVFYLSIYLDTLRWLATATCIAPLLLLRTEESAALAIRWFDRWNPYHDVVLGRAAEAPRNSIFSDIQFVAVISIVSAAARVAATTWSTLHAPLAAIRSIPGNWARIALSTDTLFPPEIIPNHPKVTFRRYVTKQRNRIRRDAFLIRRKFLKIPHIVRRRTHRFRVLRELDSAIKTIRLMRCVILQGTGGLSAGSQSIPPRRGRVILNLTRRLFGNLVRAISPTPWTNIVGDFVELFSWALAFSYAQIASVFTIIIFAPSVAYRWSLKATSIIYAPFVFVVHSTFKEGGDLREKLTLIKRSDFSKIQAAYGAFVLSVLFLKIVLMAKWAGFVAYWKSHAVLGLVGLYIVPSEIPKWQVATAINSFFAIVLLLLARHILLKMEIGKAMPEGLIKRALGLVSGLRWIITIYTITCVGYITIKEARQWQLPAFGTRWVPWETIETKKSSDPDTKSKSFK